MTSLETFRLSCSGAMLGVIAAHLVGYRDADWQAWLFMAVGFAAAFAFLRRTALEAER